MTGWRLVALTLGVCWLLILRVGPVTPWYLVHAAVPGASALRVIGRFQIVLLVPCIAIAVRLLDRMKSARGRSGAGDGAAGRTGGGNRCAGSP